MTILKFLVRFSKFKIFKILLILHRRRGRGMGAFAPQILENILGKYHVKFGHFANFSYIYFRAKMSSPKVD